MGLFNRKESGPKIICCPTCAGSQEVSPTAQSVVCRHCNTTVKVSDQKITQYSATVSLETCGELTIEKKGALVVQKRVVASNLTIKGSLKGNAIVYDTAHIAAGGQMVGELRARVIQIEEGASLKGYLQIIPADGAVKTEAPKEIAAKTKPTVARASRS